MPSVHSLWDGEPRVFLGIDTFFLFHHSPLGLANAKKYVDIEKTWTNTANRLKEIVGWNKS
jgi:hypothetical protein